MHGYIYIYISLWNKHVWKYILSLIEYCMYSSGELFMRSWDGYFCVLPELLPREINTKITFEWAHKQFITKLHTLFYFLHGKTMIFTHRPRVSFARLTLCCWRHNRLLMTPQWPGNCDAITWIMISNSLNIDFIHGDIHDRSCKELYRVIIISGIGSSLVRCDMFYRSLTYDPSSGLVLGLV